MDFHRSDVGTLETYGAAQFDVLRGKVRVKIPGECVTENLWVDGDARLHRTVAWEAPSCSGGTP